MIDYEGSYIKSIQLDPMSKLIPSYITEDDTLIGLFSPYFCQKKYDRDGILLYNIGQLYQTNQKYLGDTLYNISFGKDKKYHLLRFQNHKWNSNEYQLVIQNKGKQFIGSIELNYESKKQIEKYQEEYLNNYRIKQKKESVRKNQELKLVRSLR